jgi:carboxyl-terminal processing protease
VNKYINRKYIFITFGVILFGAVSFASGWLGNVWWGDPEIRLIKNAYQLIIDESLYNEATNRELSYAAIRGMLTNTSDEFAELIEPEAAKDLTDTFAGKTGVVGLYADNRDGRVVILTVFPDGVAEKAGLRIGDVILSIDGNTLDVAADSSETGLLLRGAPGKQLLLEIERDGQVFEYELIRQERVFVTSRMLPNDIGYISLSAFNAVASQKMKEELDSLLEQEPSALIWDLRENEGGDMQATQEIISYFIEDGLLFTAELTRERTVEFFAKGETLITDLPMVVLIDETSYSAAETAAAAIAETGRGVTVGTNSYGKGLIQATIPMVEDTMLQLTIARWLSSDGKWYHERGVTPQVEISDDPNTEVDEVLQRGVEVLLHSP